MVKDYCSFSPDNIGGVYIGDICKIHDKDYEKSNGCPIARKKADIRFMNRLTKRIGKGWSKVYFVGVRLFGWIFWIKHYINNNWR